MIIKVALTAIIAILIVLLVMTNKQNDENCQRAREWRIYSEYVAEQAEVQCDAWRGKYESTLGALDFCNKLNSGELRMTITVEESND